MAQEKSKPTVKDHLYNTYLVIGIVAFTLGAIVSYRRIKNGN